MGSTKSSKVSRSGEKLALAISRQVAESVLASCTKDLSERLRELAVLLGNCPGVSGASLIALEESGKILSFDSSKLEGETGEASFEELSCWLGEMNLQGKEPFFLKVTDGNEFWVLPLGIAGSPLGVLFVAGLPPKDTLDALTEASVVLAVAIQSAVRAADRHLREEVEELARQILRLPEFDLHQLVDRLSSLFHADAVTILLEDGGELRLAASTDRELGKGEALVYKPGQGLTGLVFQAQSVLLLNDMHDEEEIRRKTGLERKGPGYPERELLGDRSHRFLAVPMLLGGRAVGVIRMSRIRDSAPFTSQEVKGLLFFADILAGALDLSRKSELHIQRQQRIMEFLNDIGVVYFRADKNGLTLEPTSAESKILGYSFEELRGLNRERLYRDPEQRRSLMEARKAGGRLTQSVEQMIRRDGTSLLVEGDFRIVKDAMGNEVGLEGFYRDVTERILLQGFLNETTQRVLGDNELFSMLKKDAEFHLNYLTSLGHQLQTPLGSLVQTLKNFERGIVNDRKLADRLPYVIGQAVACMRLVRNLSYMDKILRGEKFQQEKVSLARLSVEIRKDFEHLLQEKGLDLKIDSDSLDRYVRVQGHREMLRQVVVNLVDNAIKYSIPGTTIQIRGRYGPRGPAFEISNHGLTILPGDRENIFERGFRSQQAKALIPGGTGLGLWLVRKIVEAHGATISCHEVHEDSQRKTLFRIIFPHLNIRRHS